MIVTKRKLYRMLSFLLALVIVLTTGIFVISNNPVADAKGPYDISEKISSTLNNALCWIKNTQNDNGSWGDEQIINDSSYGVYALRTNNIDYNKDFKYFENYDITENTDILSRIVMITGEDNSYVKTLIAMQNNDGGFGVTKRYTSEIFDTVLALEAFESFDSKAYESEIQKMIMYLIYNQEEDGSWKVNHYNGSEIALTARVAYYSNKYLTEHNLTSAETEDAFSKSDVFLSSVNSSDMNKEKIETTLYTQLYKNSRGDYTHVYDTVKAVAEAQNSNGSYYDSIYDTYLVIKYLNSLNTIDQNYTVNDMSVTLDKNTVLADDKTDIKGSYSLSYKTAISHDLNMVTKIFDDDKEIYSEESGVILSDDSNTVNGIAFTYSVNEKDSTVLKAVTILSDGEREIKKVTNLIYIQEKPIVPETKITDTGVKLSNHFGYINQSNTVNSKAYLLYTTNVKYTITTKTTVKCDNKVIDKHEENIVLTPDKTFSEINTINITIKNDSKAVYTFSTEFYDGDKLLTTAEDYYEVYDDPNAGKDEKINTITQFNIKLDDYCKYTSEVPMKVSASCEMLYNIYQDIDITVNSYILNNENEIASNTQTISLSKEDTGKTFDLISSQLDISESNEYIFKAEIFNSDGSLIVQKTTKFTVQERPEIALKLDINADTGKDYSVDLAWNDISNSYEQYGYRLLRSSDDKKTWETRSTWNDNQQVKVLNIYPNYNSKNYLQDWMNKTGDASTNEPISKNLFLIDGVLIDDYNNNPDMYLKDENGEYKYDVLMFGSYDSNGFKDLSVLSSKATHDFVDSGRGVLFGHDTVCLVGTECHENFATFGEQLGIKVTSEGIFSLSTNVKVVNEGFLTSYPWNITGNLTIPSTHVWGQYFGGTLGGTVWMTLENTSLSTDSETGGVSNAYLVTNNQLAMIQTGHSNGQATEDECKVLANTLFYLKQLTANTSVKDNSFYDEAAPSKPKVDYSLNEYSKDSYSITANMSAEDVGTTYNYKIEAMPKSASSDSIMSNTVVADAFSDMKGFIAITTDSADSAKDMIKYSEDEHTPMDIILAEDGSAEYHMNNLIKDKVYYLHIFAVDNENNISEEYVKQICDNSEVISSAHINSSLICDKLQYEIGETALITAESYTTGLSLDATADIQLETLTGTNLKTIDDSINVQLTSMSRWSKEYTLSIENIPVGKYMAVLNWKVGGEVVSKSKCLIKVTDHAQDSELKLKAEVTSGADYSNTLKWTDLNGITESEYIPNYFSVVVDCSGSMSGNRNTSAKDAINEFINHMNEQDKINIVGFNNRASNICDFTSDTDSLHKAVNSIYASGGTSVSSGMNMSISNFDGITEDKSKFNKVMILICDGDVNNCSTAVQKAIENNITVYTINVVNADVKYLQEIASQTGGRYYYSNVVSDMTNILHQIKLMSDNGNYYYQIVRDEEIKNSVTKNEYTENEFKDCASPIIISTQLNATRITDQSFSGYIDVKSKDIGTDYEYVINAVDKYNEDNKIRSNMVTATAVSGIKGYAYSIDTNSAEKPEVAYDSESFIAGDENLKIDISEYERGQIYYLHLYVIDNEGNISKETTYSFVIGHELFKSQTLTTSISTDKNSYHSDENITINVTAKTDSYKMYANGVLGIYDMQGNLVETVEPNYVAEITSYKESTKNFVWTVKNIVAGEYQASIKWYDGEKLVASDSALFNIISDGNIKDNVNTDKKAYMSNETVNLTDYIYNNTTNTYSNDLNVKINIIDDSENVVQSVAGTVNLIAGKMKKFSDSIKASEIGTGNYKVVSYVSIGNDVVSSSSSQFTVSELTDPSEIFIGKIETENYDNKNKMLKYSVTNNSTFDCKNTIVRATIYSEDGSVISTIDKTIDIVKSETKEFEQLYNTEALKIGVYPVVLSVITDNGESVLSESGFYINFINKYNVTFVNDDGTEISSQQVEYGSAAKSPSNPKKIADAQYSYTFIGWDKDFSNITEDTIITAQYSKVLNEYTVTFISDKTVLSTQSVKYGSPAVAPESPQKADDDKYSYTFIGWDKDYSNITGDLTVKAQFESREKANKTSSDDSEQSLSQSSESVNEETTNVVSQQEASNQENSVQESGGNVQTGESGNIFFVLVLITLIALCTIIITEKNIYSGRKDK